MLLNDYAILNMLKTSLLSTLWSLQSMHFSWDFPAMQFNEEKIRVVTQGNGYTNTVFSTDIFILNTS